MGHKKIDLRQSAKHTGHIDEEWINKKIHGHGGAFGYNSYTGLATLIFIGCKPGILIFWYNIILFFKYLKRICTKGVRKCFIKI
jgi:hypothetical protein